MGYKYKIKKLKGKYYFELEFGELKYLFYRSIGYQELYECKNGIDRVIKNMNCKIKV